MSNTLQWTISNRMEDISRLIADVHEKLLALQIDPDASYNVEFAIEEMLTNTVKFGYGDTNTHEIRVAVIPADGEITLRLVDDGREFNPLTAAEPDTSLPLEERPIGGLGILLVRRMASHIDYRREEGQNILTLVYPQPPKSPESPIIKQ